MPRERLHRMKTATFNIPLRDRNYHERPPFHLKFIEDKLLDIFGGYSSGSGKGAWRDAEGHLFEDDIKVYEVVFPDRQSGAIIDCAKRFAELLKESIFVNIAGKACLVGDNRVQQSIGYVSADIQPFQWPKQFDIAIQTPIGVELEAVQKHFGIDKKKDRRPIQGSIFYRGKAFSTNDQEEIAVVVFCQGIAGNEAAAIGAERLINRWNPKAIFLIGIAAGRRNKVQIGDVVTPRVVVNDTQGVAEAKRRLKRPIITSPPYVIIQLLQNYSCNENKWHKQLLDAQKPPRAPQGKGKFYRKHISKRPAHHEAAIYSSNLLLRDQNILEAHAKETHQQIKIGEMEAAGFCFACHYREHPVPWWIVRGVSDFGDKSKSDKFHKWAANAAASYLLCFIEDGNIIDLLSKKKIQGRK